MKFIICLFVFASSVQFLVEAKSFDFGQFFGIGAAEDKSLVRTERVEDKSTPDNEDTLVSESFIPSTVEEAKASYSSSDIALPSLSSFKSTDNDRAFTTQEFTTETQAESTVSYSSIFSSSDATEKSVTSEYSKSSSEITVTTVTNDLSSNDEQEQVISVTTQTTVIPVPETFLQKSLDWMKDAYTLSILIPVGAGVLFACSIIVTISICRCCRRCCRRRKFQRQALPDSVKNLRPSDRAMLLGESSDDEF